MLRGVLLTSLVVVFVACGAAAGGPSSAPTEADEGVITAGAPCDPQRARALDRELDADGKLDRRARALRELHRRCETLPPDLALRLVGVEIELGNALRARSLLPLLPMSAVPALERRLSTVVLASPWDDMIAADEALAAGRPRDAQRLLDRSLAGYERLTGRTVRPELLAERPHKFAPTGASAEFSSVRVTRLRDGARGLLVNATSTAFGHLVMADARSIGELELAGQTHALLTGAAGFTWILAPELPVRPRRAAVADMTALGGDLIGLSHDGGWARLDPDTLDAMETVAPASKSTLLATDGEHVLALLEAPAPSLHRVTLVDRRTKQPVSVELPRPPAAAAPVVAFDEERSRALIASRAGVVYAVPYGGGPVTKHGAPRGGFEDGYQVLEMALTPDGRFACVRHGWSGSIGARANTCERHLIALTADAPKASRGTWSTCLMQDGHATVVSVPWQRERIGAPPDTRAGGAKRSLLTGASGAFTEICGLAVSSGGTYVGLLETARRADGVFEDVDALVLDAGGQLLRRVRLLDGEHQGGHAHLAFEGDAVLRFDGWGKSLAVRLPSGGIEQVAPPAPQAAPVKATHRFTPSGVFALERTALFPGGAWLLAGREASTLWSLATGTVLRDLGAATPVVVSPNGELLATVDGSGIHVTDVGKNQTWSYAGGGRLLAVSSQGWLALEREPGPALAVRQPFREGYREVARIGDTGRIDAAVFAPDGAQLATLAMGETVGYRWDPRRRALERAWSAPIGSPTLAYAPSGDWLLAGTAVLSAVDGTQKAALAVSTGERILSLDVDGAGRILALFERPDTSRVLALFDHQSGARGPEVRAPRATEARFTASGAIVAAGDAGRAWMFDRRLRLRRAVAALGPRAAVALAEGRVEALGEASLAASTFCAFGEGDAWLLAPWRVCSSRFEEGCPGDGC